ncbi:hypothetical protein BU25DRAFT_161441 [Macroventuria anomochaeta]|uniref:Uncharacterized protein n=1 Tax=Macroventuria anomochaeta TaxID=301207 RepID=A0ACB6RRX0_9PLEO|nr:uncharacterized protein BU25DRAFT_161441 [Macroventuria anomochaeta]KAF2624452.1 hypothetical protein BU25DRAFT_161441 [Macroventuria anomochaeta]
MRLSFLRPSAIFCHCNIPMQSRGVRTRTGCWTCRKRRKKCDEKRPYCTNCAALSLRCAGYTIRLRWTEPQQTPKALVKDDPQVRTLPAGSCKDASDTEEPNDRRREAILLYHLRQDGYKSLTDTERGIIYDFIQWGAATLIPGIGTTREKYFEIFAQSKGLLASCLAYHTTLSPKYSGLEDQYYQRSIEVFRRELSDPLFVANEATVYAALMLSSISMNRGVPWTVHVNGIASILDQQKSYACPDGRIKDYTSFMGILDLPTHILGRKTINRNIWYTHCRLRDGIDVVTGLPCSLIDLLSAINQPYVVPMLMNWRIEEGTKKQQQIWDANRHAAIIVGLNPGSIGQGVNTHVRQAVTLLRELKGEISDEFSQVRQALLFPLVITGSQSLSLSDDDKLFIMECISDLADGSLEHNLYYCGAGQILQELWYNDAGRSLQQIAEDLGIEQGLF